jgi:hypothetical protein
MPAVRIEDCEAVQTFRLFERIGPEQSFVTGIFVLESGIAARYLKLRLMPRYRGVDLG